MKTPLYAALDLHSRYSVLGSMDYDGNSQPKERFPISALLLRQYNEALRQKKRPIYLTMEAGAFTRWASAISRPLLERLLICAPCHNRLIHSDQTKSDEADGGWVESFGKSASLSAFPELARSPTTSLARSLKSRDASAPNTNSGNTASSGSPIAPAMVSR